jgi:hypothetical protein
MSETHAEEPPIETADEAKRVEFEVVRRSYKPHKNPRGQTRRLTLRVFIRICHRVEQGWAITKACESESITYSLFRIRCSENPRPEQRIKEAEAIRFQRRHEEAVGQKSWMAHAWYLERVLPNLYALKKDFRREQSEKGGTTVALPAPGSVQQVITDHWVTSRIYRPNMLIT